MFRYFVKVWCTNEQSSNQRGQGPPSARTVDTELSQWPRPRLAPAPSSRGRSAATPGRSAVSLTSGPAETDTC